MGGVIIYIYEFTKTLNETSLVMSIDLETTMQIFGTVYNYKDVIEKLNSFAILLSKIGENRIKVAGFDENEKLYENHMVLNHELNRIKK